MKKIFRHDKKFTYDVLKEKGACKQLLDWYFKCYGICGCLSIKELIDNNLSAEWEAWFRVHFPLVFRNDPQYKPGDIITFITGPFIQYAKVKDISYDIINDETIVEISWIQDSFSGVYSSKNFDVYNSFKKVNIEAPEYLRRITTNGSILEDLGVSPVMLDWFYSKYDVKKENIPIYVSRIWGDLISDDHRKFIERIFPPKESKVETEDAKYCVDCKYFRYGLEVKNHRCAHPKYVNLITGLSGTTCERMRDDSDSCGRDGILFETKRR
jgi:hypothetical protein